MPGKGADKAMHCQHRKSVPGKECWFESYGLRPMIAAASLRQRRRDPVRAQLRNHALKSWGQEISALDPEGLLYLQKLQPMELFDLLSACDSRLFGELQTIIDREKLEVQVRLKPVKYPSLPDALLAGLKKYERKEKTRLMARLRNGYQRDADALRRIMVEPIALATFLGHQGIDRWELMKLAHQVQFCGERKNRAKKIQKFLRFLRAENPFKQHGGPQRKSALPTALREAAGIPYLAEQALKEKVAEAKERLSAVDFLVFCLVARVGLTAKKAYGLQLHQINESKEGRVLIRPEKFWLALPPKLGQIMRGVAKKLDDNWPHPNPDDAKKRLVFAESMTYEHILRNVLQHQAKLLRTSAILSAIRAGKTDRKFLQETIGVSPTTLVQLEFLVSADLHSLLPAGFVKDRNKFIRGKD